MHIPRATYRVQFTPEFGFKEARAIVPYLVALGVSDIYASPIFKAVPGSLHGYDVTDPNMLNPQLGTREDFESLSAELKKHNMSWLQDIVPNHTAFHKENKMLMDLMEKGPQSDFADFFDIRTCREDEGRFTPVGVPVLGEPFEEAVEGGKIRLVYEKRKLRAKYFELAYPLKWESYTRVLNGQKAANAELQNCLATLDTPEEPAAGKEEALLGISNLYENDPQVKMYVDSRLEYINGQNELRDKYELLNQILSEQYFKFISWRESYKIGNYRRFFYLNDFICLNMGKRDVFERTHRLIFKLLGDGFIQGLRVDHIDGLYQPLRYLSRLRRRFSDIYIIVEKILSMDEALPAAWPIQGTTGYDFMNFVNGLFCDPKAERAITELYDTFVGESKSWTQILRDSKVEIMKRFMECDLLYLARLAAKAIKQHNGTGPVSIENIKHVLSSIIAELELYRTYIDEDVSTQDRKRLELAIEKAADKLGHHIKEFKSVKELLLSNISQKTKAGEDEDFLMRFQQLTGPVTAKGLEDTAFYRYNRLVSLNEVGGHPERFGVLPHDFDGFIGERAWTFRCSMNATSTHDSKRGEDARARINVLTEMPDLWRQAVEHWAAINQEYKRKTGSEPAPSRDDEYLLYQNMIGSFPCEREKESEFYSRLKDAAIKSAREAKTHTDWDNPKKEYEDALKGFIDDITKPGRRFIEDFKEFHKQTAYWGIFNSLSQTVIKMTAPGVPDFYQGSELWNLSMVDPDNRHKIDFNDYKNALKDIQTKVSDDVAALLRDLLKSPADGRIKMYVIYKVLHLRAGFCELFEQGDYVALDIRGDLKDNLIAFARVFKEHAAIIVVPRFLSKIASPGQLPLGSVWENTEIALPLEGLMPWYDCFTEARLDLDKTCKAADLLRSFPVACIVNSAEFHLKRN